MEKLKIGFADILTAFQEEGTIGTKVWWQDKADFLGVLEEEISKFDWNSCRQSGQAYIVLPKKCCKWVSAGVGKRTLDPDDYVVRRHRESVKLYLKRSFAAEVDNVAVVVYTRNAYLADPDVTEEEADFIRFQNCTHILVAVLAASGPKSPLTPTRFVHNLAGGNKEALLWTADEIREKAKEIKDYSNEWCMVAD